MDFENINITYINPSGYNPRVITEDDYNSLKNSISEFGLVDPIIVNLKNNTIIGGHQRYNVLLNEYLDTGENSELNILKLGDVGWCFPDVDLSIVSDEHEKALNVALNKISGDWDNKKLDDLLIELDSKDFNIQLTGFNEIDMKKLSFENEIKFDNDEDEGFKLILDFNSREELEGEYEKFLGQGFDCEMIMY